MNTRKLLLRFPDGAPPWARWGKRVKIDGSYYRVGRVTRREALLYAEASSAPVPRAQAKQLEDPSASLY